MVADLEVERSTQQTRIEDLEIKADGLQEQFAASADIARLQGETERNALQSQLAEVEVELATVAEARRFAGAEMAEANRAIGELIGEGVALNQQVAELETKTETLAADVAACELQLEESQTELARAERQAAELATERETLAATVGRGDQKLAETRTALAALDDEHLSETHEIIRVGHRDGDYQVDLGSKASIEALLGKAGTVGAVISTAGAAGFAPFQTLDDAAYDLALANKLMGRSIWFG